MAAERPQLCESLPALSVQHATGGLCARSGAEVCGCLGGGAAGGAGVMVSDEPAAETDGGWQGVVCCEAGIEGAGAPDEAARAAPAAAFLLTGGDARGLQES